MDLMEFHDLADIRPDTGLENAMCGYANIGKHMKCAGDEALIWNKNYMGFLPACGSSFEFFSLRAILRASTHVLDSLEPKELEKFSPPRKTIRRVACKHCLAECEIQNSNLAKLDTDLGASQRCAFWTSGIGSEWISRGFMI